MRLRVLGCGTIKTPQLKNCSGYLVNDELLLDCGPGVWRAVGNIGIKNSSIKYIALSHFHADHVSDLAAFLLERYLSSDSPLKLIGPKGIKDWFSNFSFVFGEWMKFMLIEIVECDSKFRIDEYYIETMSTGHTENSICYRITDSESKVMFYTGDSGENENINNLSKNADLGIFEASNTQDTKISDHLTPTIAAQVAQKSNVKKLLLTHFYPEVYNSEELLNARKIYTGELIIAEDNMTLETK